MRSIARSLVHFGHGGQQEPPTVSLVGCAGHLDGAPRDEWPGEQPRNGGDSVWRQSQSLCEKSTCRISCILYQYQEWVWRPRSARGGFNVFGISDETAP